MDVIDYIKSNRLIFDGAMGTMLQRAGLEAGGLPEVYNIEHPETVLSIHRQYIDAGADVITSNTFQANAFKLKGSGYSVEEIIASGVALAKKSGAKYAALDIGPLGQLMEPMGTLGFDEAYKLFKEQLIAGEKAGADLVLFETMSDLLEVKAAVLAARENTSLPVFVTMTFQEDGRTFVGCDPVSAAVTLSGLRVDALGVNCSLGPDRLMPVIDKLAAHSRVPLMVQPNAGLPSIRNGETSYDITAEEFAGYMRKIAEKGAAVIGGCCGTTPEYIRKTKEAIADLPYVKLESPRETAVCSGTKTVIFDQGVTLIGERINPTGKKKLKEKLRAQDFGYLVGEAISQKDAGADVLDVNCGLPEIDEAAALTRAVREIQAAVNLPLQLDSSDAAAIEKAIRVYNGKPIINSVNGKAESLEAILPIAAKYGAVVVGLCLDESGIPEAAEGRLRIAEKIIAAAESFGIPKEDIIIDCLVLTASAQQSLVIETIKAIRLVKRLGVKTVLGVSNVSFGLPARPILNSVFLAAGFGAGLDSAIVNPMSAEIMKVFRAYKVLNNQDKDAVDYINNYADYKTENTLSAGPAEKSDISVSDGDLKTAIIDGRRELARDLTGELLKTSDPISIINQYFIPALDIVGDRYESGTVFLPQLIQSAEAVKSGFGVLKESSATEDGGRGKIILATVRGDIHDIGKNIVKMLLENYGYDVIDLGKDVPEEVVVKAAIKHDIKLIGLSALMTTTVKSMKDTIAALKKAGCKAKIVVGGAVLNEEYVEFVGADYYGKDAGVTVKIANEVFGHGN